MCEIILFRLSVVFHIIVNLTSLRVLEKLTQIDGNLQMMDSLEVRSIC